MRFCPPFMCLNLILTAISGKITVALNGGVFKTYQYKFSIAKPAACGKYTVKKLDRRIELLILRPNPDFHDCVHSGPRNNS